MRHMGSLWGSHSASWVRAIVHTTLAALPGVTGWLEMVSLLPHAMWVLKSSSLEMWKVAPC